MSRAGRRPIRARDSSWARTMAARMATAGIAPNRISQASLVFAFLGFLAFLASSRFSGPWSSACLVGAAASIQLRLICNMLDGMVALEGGRSGPTGPFWNEAPDRLADLLFLAGAGLAAGQVSLGLTAAACAIATAYLRELGRAEGLAPDYGGPMAKPQRMAALTVGALVAAVHAPDWSLAMTLWIILIGTLITIFLRARRMLNALAER